MPKSGPRSMHKTYGCLIRHVLKLGPARSCYVKVLLTLEITCSGLSLHVGWNKLGTGSRSWTPSNRFTSGDDVAGWLYVGYVLTSIAPYNLLNHAGAWCAPENGKRI
jgi:hypothetical protein